ncbi:uncharacterized protein CIMG_12141 [Coccidioides immitis RS]|uniref:Uncharacterized protein n=1 Tax=Coccidioides immitis (strain RS) TaxID=246410 RepID=A0A0D8JTX4_COCIM|nr:uncharacterized protein CIMG_12141 [Coccidioides immitis RS]KJF60795.1 hypothetical protein CIMG_12141 [Coccidioides immitis RS]
MDNASQTQKQWRCVLVIIIEISLDTCELKMGDAWDSRIPDYSLKRFGCGVCGNGPGPSRSFLVLFLADVLRTPYIFTTLWNATRRDYVGNFDHSLESSRMGADDTVFAELMEALDFQPVRLEAVESVS